MENIVRVITINQNDEGENMESRGITDFSSFPCRPCNIILPRDNSGYVYLLISLRSEEFIHICKTKDLHQRMISHQSDLGSNTIYPEYLMRILLISVNLTAMKV